MILRDRPAFAPVPQEGWTPFSGVTSIFRPAILFPRASVLPRGTAYSGAMATLPLPTAAESDQSLLERVGRGDEVALERLYDKYSSALYAVAYRISGERFDAEEIVLDSFAQAWRDAPRFQSARGSVIAWLTMICRSRALDLVRSRGRRSRVVTKAAAAEPDATPAMGVAEPGTDRDLERMERRKVVAEALMALSPPQRQAVQLAYYEGLSHSEIAERLGEPLGTVKTRVRLAMQRLRETLRPYYAEQAV
jgi:RNA polymerase sigma-70 factor, ECF subfamily